MSLFSLSYRSFPAIAPLGVLTCCGLMLSPSYPVLAFAASDRPQTPAEMSQTLPETWIAQAALARYHDRLLQADQFYRNGNLQQAALIQSELKPEFTGGGTAVTEPIMDINSPRLSGGAGVYWRNAQEGLQQNLESKIFEPLHRLTENFPDFVPGHIALAEACETNPVGCERSADGNQPATAIDAIDRASALFPNHPDLLKTHIQILLRSVEETKKPYPLLEASILARQYAVSNPDRPEARQYRVLAQQLEDQYKAELESLIYSQAFIQSIFGSGRDILMIMAQGESAFGEWQRDLILESRPLLQNPEIQSYVRRIGRQLAQDTGRSDFNYEFFVVDDPTPNASAVAGGKIFVNSGLLTFLQTEAELAGILSHEIAHTTLSHGYLEAAEDMATDDALRTLLGGSLGGSLAVAANAERSRKHERASDILGTRLLARTEYSADGLHSAMARFAALEGDRRSSWVASHPIGTERVAYLEDLILRNSYNRYGYEGVADYIAMQQSLTGTTGTTAIASSGANSGSSTASVTGSTQNNLTDATVVSSSAPEPSVPAATVPTTGPVPLNINQDRNGVRIDITEADVTSRGTYALKFTVSNNTSDLFGFVIPFSQILDQAGNRVTAKFYCEEQTFLDPGTSVTCECQIFGQQWQSTARQNLVMVIKEGTVAARVFRIAF